MSTIDPQEARRQQIQDQKGSARALVDILISDVVILAATAAFVRGMFAFALLPPEGSNTPPDGVFFMPIGVILVIGGAFMHVGGVRKYSGPVIQPSPGIGIFPLTCIGAAAGAWWGWSAVGRGLLWIPIALSVFALLMLGLGIAMRLGERARNASRAEIASRGRIVPGTVTHCPIGDPNARASALPLTVKFTDAAGTNRWVSRVVTWTEESKPDVGDTLAVLFDPTDPGNERHIWIGPAGATRAEEFVA